MKKESQKKSNIKRKKSQAQPPVPPKKEKDTAKDKPPIQQKKKTNQKEKLKSRASSQSVNNQTSQKGESGAKSDANGKDQKDLDTVSRQQEEEKNVELKNQDIEGQSIQLNIADDTHNSVSKQVENGEESPTHEFPEESPDRPLTDLNSQLSKNDITIQGSTNILGEID